MSRDSEMISADQDIWGKIEDQDVRDDWAVHQAAHSGLVQAPLSIFVRFGYKNLVIEEIIKSDLTEQLVSLCEVPEDRVDEVFEKAEQLIQQRMEIDGEA